MKNKKYRELGAILFVIVIVSFFITATSVAKLMYQSYDKYGLTGVFAFIGLATTTYFVIYIVQKIYQTLTNKYIKITK
jgi:hypothetical protein